MFKKLIPFIISIAATLSLGMLAGKIAHAGDTTWYQALAKPWFNPPSWIFAPIWTIIYVLIGIAVVYIYRLHDHQSVAHKLLMLNMICNYSWSYVFFKMHEIGIALLVVELMIISAFGLLFIVRKHTTIVRLLTPYIAWICFAGFLNYQIYTLN